MNTFEILMGVLLGGSWGFYLGLRGQVAVLRQRLDWLENVIITTPAKRYKQYWPQDCDPDCSCNRPPNGYIPPKGTPYPFEEDESS